MKILRTFLMIMCLLALAISGFGQRRSDGMNRGGGGGFRQSAPASRPSTPAYQAPRQSAPMQTAPRQGGMNRSGGASFNQTQRSTTYPRTSRGYVYSRPAFVAPRYHYNIGYHISVIPSSRYSIYVGGRWAWYYPAYGQYAWYNDPYTMSGNYNQNMNYAPPAGVMPPDYNYGNPYGTTTQTTTNPDGSTTQTTTTRAPSFWGSPGGIILIIVIIIAVCVILNSLGVFGSND